MDEADKNKRKPEYYTQHCLLSRLPSEVHMYLLASRDQWTVPSLDPTDGTIPSVDSITDGNIPSVEKSPI
jgi:hypothetical protein